MRIVSKKPCPRGLRGKSYKLREEKGKRWKPINICGFIRDNVLDTHEIRHTAALRRGDSVVLGGGAAPFYSLKRTR